MTSRRAFLTTALRATVAGVLVPEWLLDPLKGRSMVSVPGMWGHPHSQAMLDWYTASSAYLPLVNHDVENFHTHVARVIWGPSHPAVRRAAQLPPEDA